jgi:hypothetical protein
MIIEAGALGFADLAKKIADIAVSFSYSTRRNKKALSRGQGFLT